MTKRLNKEAESKSEINICYIIHTHRAFVPTYSFSLSLMRGKLTSMQYTNVHTKKKRKKNF